MGPGYSISPLEPCKWMLNNCSFAIIAPPNPIQILLNDSPVAVVQVAAHGDGAILWLYASGTGERDALDGAAAPGIGLDQGQVGLLVEGDAPV